MIPSAASTVRRAAGAPRRLARRLGALALLAVTVLLLAHARPDAVPAPTATSVVASAAVTAPADPCGAVALAGLEAVDVAAEADPALPGPGEGGPVARSGAATVYPGASAVVPRHRAGPSPLRPPRPA